MKTVKIEFFHDIICSFCFPMSYRMRQLKEQFPDIDIIHRSFALAKEPEDFTRMFGSHLKAKAEILSHWHHANQNDDLHRFNIEGMKQADFLFPTSMNGLLACKAAYFIGGQDLYWDLFDVLQQKLFVESQNIEDILVIENAVSEVSIDLDIWRKHFYDPETKNAVERDLQLATKYQIQSVPTLIIDEKYPVSGAQPLDSIISIIKEIRIQKSLLDVNSGASCNLINGKIECD